MNTAIIVQGRIAAGQFTAGEPLPDVEGQAELIVYAKKATERQSPATSIFDLFGRAERLRSGEDIDAQVREERAAWGDR
jgi:hypothetical protein